MTKQLEGAKRRTWFCGDGWVYFNPDSGWEYSREHPKRSGECENAQSVRRSTEQEDNLWSWWQEQWRRAEALQKPDHTN